MTALFQGWLEKKSRYLNRWRKRWVVLRDDQTLSTYKTQTDSKCTECIDLSVYRNLIISFSTQSFELCATSKESFQFKTSNTEEMTFWQQSIEKVILSTNNKAPAIYNIAALIINGFIRHHSSPNIPSDITHLLCNFYYLYEPYLLIYQTPFDSDSDLGPGSLVDSLEIYRRQFGIQPFHSGNEIKEKKKTLSLLNLNSGQILDLRFPSIIHWRELALTNGCCVHYDIAWNSKRFESIQKYTMIATKYIGNNFENSNISIIPPSQYFCNVLLIPQRPIHAVYREYKDPILECFNSTIEIPQNLIMDDFTMIYNKYDKAFLFCGDSCWNICEYWTETCKWKKLKTQVLNIDNTINNTFELEKKLCWMNERQRKLFVMCFYGTPILYLYSGDLNSLTELKEMKCNIRYSSTSCVYNDVFQELMVIGRDEGLVMQSYDVIQNEWNICGNNIMSYAADHAHSTNIWIDPLDHNLTFIHYSGNMKVFDRRVGVKWENVIWKRQFDSVSSVVREANCITNVFL